jgi:hypothetical protein
VTTYVLPRRLSERLEGALSGCRHAAEAMALATFLGRFWSLPAKLGQPFHVDRRALADRPDLGLSEKRVRRALEALVTVGFLKRQPDRGSAYRMTDEGLRRKPALYRFGAEWWSIFASVCRKAARAVREAVSRIAGHHPPSRRPPVLHGPFPGGPKRTAGLEPSVHMGLAPQASASDLKLEAALERLRQGVFGRAEGGSGEGSAQ